MTIGSASDFYRVRLQRLDDTDAVEFEWREDILYRTPPAGEVVEDEDYRVEAVLLDDEDTVFVLGTFEERPQADAFLAECQSDLQEMTKSEFEERYFPQAP